MASRNRSLTGTVAGRSDNTSDTELTFPASLIHPPQSQVARSEDAVTDRISRLDGHAQKLGEGFGIPFGSFVLNPLPQVSGDNGLAALAIVLRTLTHREERVGLERRNGRWGLYFTREPAVIAQERRADAVLLKDAPLDVRERFLLQSENFFRAYLELCKDRLGRMQSSVSQADRTLDLLGRLRLE